MPGFAKSVFEGQLIVLDGKEYIDCVFISCHVTITRGNYSLKGCKFTNCTFEFGGEAENIKNLVLGLVHDPGLVVKRVTKSPPETQKDTPKAKQSPPKPAEPDNDRNG